MKANWSLIYDIVVKQLNDVGISRGCEMKDY